MFMISTSDCMLWRINKHVLTHWGREAHICVSKLTIIASDNGLSPGRRQAIIWTNAWILLIGPLGTNFNEILIEIHTFSSKKMHLKISSAKWRPFCLGLNVLTLTHILITNQNINIQNLGRNGFIQAIFKMPAMEKNSKSQDLGWYL